MKLMISRWDCMRCHPLVDRWPNLRKANFVISTDCCVHFSLPGNSKSDLNACISLKRTWTLVDVASVREWKNWRLNTSSPVCGQIRQGICKKTIESSFILRHGSGYDRSTSSSSANYPAMTSAEISPSSRYSETKFILSSSIINK